MIELIVGGARSGKSRYAEQRAAEWAREAPGRQVVYVATAEALDAEMATRIAHHRTSRPASWATVEAPLALTEALTRHAAGNCCLLVDCLTLWLTNQLLAARLPDSGKVGEKQMTAELDAFIGTLSELPGRVILVSNEVGWGVVPMNALARRFADEQGRLNQRVAQVAQRVSLTVAGLPMLLKAIEPAQ